MHLKAIIRNYTRRLPFTPTNFKNEVELQNSKQKCARILKYAMIFLVCFSLSCTIICDPK